MLASHFQVKALLKNPGGLPLFSVENGTFLKNSGPRTLRQRNNEAVLHWGFFFGVVLFFVKFLGIRRDFMVSVTDQIMNCTQETTVLTLLLKLNF